MTSLYASLDKGRPYILAGYMAVAYFIAHFPSSWFPAANGGGRWSIDRAYGLENR
jgi:hypothetical protein